MYGRPVFADPKVDFVFKKLFGSEEHKGLLVALLNALLDLSGPHEILDVSFLREEQRPAVEELKFSIVDVKCQDAAGVTYVVEMQVLNVEGFEKRVVYNASKAYVSQLHRGRGYPMLDDVIAVSICDFSLWPDGAGGQGAEGAPDGARSPPVPMLSRWRLQEQTNGRLGLSQVQYVFLELPKLKEGAPETLVEKWAWFFRHASELAEVPEALAEEAPGRALEVARTAHFTPGEWEAYDERLIAEQDARGALSLALKTGRDEGRKEGRDEGRKEGRAEGLRAALLRILEARGLSLSPADAARVAACERPDVLEGWLDRALRVEGVGEVFGGGVG